MLSRITLSQCPAALIPCNTASTFPVAKIKKYELLLYKIATCFGLNSKEASALVQQTCSDALRYFQYQENLSQMKLVLSKMIVQKCIFKISSEYFSSIDLSNGKREAGCFIFYSSFSSSCLRNMPLSLRAVFILNSVGFDETEIAQILNASLLTVKMRLNKASTMINGHD